MGDHDHFKNGVHVSHWVDVAPNVDQDSIHTLTLPDITNNTGRRELCMQVLRDIAVELGPYDVAICNCHHAALSVYNACAVAEAQIPYIPNFMLTLGAWALGTVGLDVLRSECGASNFASASSRPISLAS